MNRRVQGSGRLCRLAGQEAGGDFQQRELLPRRSLSELLSGLSIPARSLLSSPSSHRLPLLPFPSISPVHLEINTDTGFFFSKKQLIFIFLPDEVLDFCLFVVVAFRERYPFGSLELHPVAD